MIAHRVRALLALLLLLLTLAACAQPPAADETGGDDSAPTATPTAAPAAEATATATPLAATPSPSPAFSLEALRHGEYTFEGQTIRLEAGQAELPIVDGSASTMKVTLLEETVAFGDLNGDTIEDAAAVVTVDMGGSGTFYHLVALLNRDGQPQQSASHLLGDRIQVKSIVVEAGEIAMEMVWAGPDDPMCCPTQEVSARYVLQEVDAMMSLFRLEPPETGTRPIHTSVVRFEPTIPAEVQEGSCFSSSIAAPREGAWRCMVGNAIHDPCFTAADGATLVCGADPIEGTAGFQLNLTEPLPVAEIPADLPPMGWLLRLSDGSVCNFATGATGAVGDKRANYLCSDQSVILGDLQVNDAGTWLAEKAFVTVGENGMEAQETSFVAVMELWQ